MRPFLKVHPALELAELRATALLGPGTGSALSIGTIPWLQQHSLQISSSSALPRPGKGSGLLKANFPILDPSVSPPPTFHGSALFRFPSVADMAEPIDMFFYRPSSAQAMCRVVAWLKRG